MKISAEEYLKTLTEKSVWVFTKQKVSSFDEIIKVTNYLIVYQIEKQLI